MSFDPTYPHNLTFLPPKFDFDTKNFTKLLIDARSELAELKGYSFSMPNPLLLLSPAIIKESLASSEIENINTTIINVLENQLFPEAEQREPDKEVLRYRDAVIAGFSSLNKYSLSTRTIHTIQKVLLPGVPEGYRQVQNGIKNTATGEIVYMPPVASRTPELMGNLENFMNDKSNDIDPLIKCAISHYQFEAVHPFGDGNGRTGRILMVLYLVYSEVLSLPILYISGYINANRAEYYRSLLEVTINGNWNEYITFMLKGFQVQAKETKELLFKIMSFFFELKKELKTNHKKIYSADLAEALCSYPVVTPVKLANVLEIHYTTASRYLHELAKAEVLGEKKYGKYHLFANRRLLKIIHNQ